uniref:Uncharacterized protein n=1 Tax=Arundo donax TaxID=35708 RepID=A0A0A9AXW3_ARUDO
MRAALSPSSMPNCRPDAFFLSSTAAHNRPLPRCLLELLLVGLPP